MEALEGHGRSEEETSDYCIAFGASWVSRVDLDELEMAVMAGLRWLVLRHRRANDEIHDTNMSRDIMKASWRSWEVKTF